MGENEHLLDFKGAHIEINGETFVAEEGELTVEKEYLRDAHGEVQEVLDRQVSLSITLHDPGGERAFTDQPVYAVFEYREGTDDSLVTIFEDDAETLREFISYAGLLGAADGDTLTGEFHAANPGDEHLSRGDWYLTKQHGVGISHGLLFGGGR